MVTFFRFAVRGVACLSVRLVLSCCGLLAGPPVLHLVAEACGMQVMPVTGVEDLGCSECISHAILCVAHALKQLQGLKGMTVTRVEDLESLFVRACVRARVTRAHPQT